MDTSPKIVMTNGCFDILHPGHLRLLTSARAMGDRLIVAVNTDESVKRLKGDGRPINRLFHRVQMLHALKAVDDVVPFDTEEQLERIIAYVQPAILVKAGYTEDKITGASIVRGYGGRVELVPILEGFSTTDIIRRIHDARCPLNQE